jgi:hypothetical protein
MIATFVIPSYGSSPLCLQTEILFILKPVVGFFFHLLKFLNELAIDHPKSEPNSKN